MRYLVGKINRFCGLFLFFILVFILAALISFPLAMTVLASSSDAPDTVPTDGTYIEGTITPVDESSFSGETLAGMYPFSLSDAGLVELHFITHTSQNLRVKVMDADENLLCDDWVSTMSSPEHRRFYLDPGSYSVCVYISYADTSGDYRFFLKETSLHMPPENIVCNQSYEGFFHSSSDDTFHEQHTFRLTAPTPVSSIECSSTAGLELTIRDLNENILYSMITDNGRQEELQLPPGEYILMVESFGIAGEYSFRVHTAGTSNEGGAAAETSTDGPYSDPSDNIPAAGSENGSENGLENGPENEIENVSENVSETGGQAVSPDPGQPSGTDPAADSSGDESSASTKAKGPLSWLKDNLLSPETFIGAIVVGVLVNKISDLLSKKKD